MRGNVSTLIVIWGAAILIFIAVSKASGTVSVLNSFSNFVQGTTKTLQGR